MRKNRWDMVAVEVLWRATLSLISIKEKAKPF